MRVVARPDVASYLSRKPVPLTARAIIARAIVVSIVPRRRGMRRGREEEAGGALCGVPAHRAHRSGAGNGHARCGKQEEVLVARRGPRFTADSSPRSDRDGTESMQLCGDPCALSRKQVHRIS